MSSSVIVRLPASARAAPLLEERPAAGRRLPDCARFAGCDERVERRDVRGVTVRHRCNRRARFVVERPGEGARNACPEHARPDPRGR